MALAVVQVYARSAWRVRVVFSGGNPSSVQPGDFTVTRQDGGPCSITVASLMVIDGTALEVVLSESVISRVVYVMTWSATGIPFSFSPPAALDPSVQPQGDDPDAEANGVDLAWISDNPSSSGDCPQRRGTACVQYDLENRAFLVPGELMQDTSAGGNVQRLVNSSSSDAELLQAGARLDAEFKRDSRVADSSMNVTVDTQGQSSFNGQVKTRAGQQAPVRST